MDNNINRKNYTFEDTEAIATFLLEKCRYRPEIGIICGSGLSGLADILKDQETFPYEDIPNFPICTVRGHKARLVFGILSDKPVVCMQGRFHSYEGYSSTAITLPVRVMRLLGAKVIIVTNAAGSINRNYKPGDIMIIKDHINFPGIAGNSALRGHNEERFGPRFPSMDNVYNHKLRELIKIAAKNCEISDIKEGVYAYLGGPSFETVAEIRFLKIAGADVVGMSTVPEVIAARHCGLKVCGMSLITNVSVMDYDSDDKPDHNEVLTVGNAACIAMQSLVSDLVRLIEL